MTNYLLHHHGGRRGRSRLVIVVREGAIIGATCFAIVVRMCPGTELRENFKPFSAAEGAGIRRRVCLLHRSGMYKGKEMSRIAWLFVLQHRIHDSSGMIEIEDVSRNVQDPFSPSILDLQYSGANQVLHR